MIRVTTTSRVARVLVPILALMVAAGIGPRRAPQPVPAPETHRHHPDSPPSPPPGHHHSTPDADCCGLCSANCAVVPTSEELRGHAAPLIETAPQIVADVEVPASPPGRHRPASPRAPPLSAFTLVAI